MSSYWAVLRVERTRDFTVMSNYQLVELRHKYYAEIQFRIEQAQRKKPKLKVRRDSAKFIDTIVAATPDYLTQLPPEQVRRYFERALELFNQEVGAEKIFSAVVHAGRVAEQVSRPYGGGVPGTGAGADRRTEREEAEGENSKVAGQSAAEWADLPSGNREGQAYGSLRAPGEAVPYLRAAGVSGFH